MNQKNNFILPNDDPLGIRKVVLGGASPSLQVEAEIAVRQYFSKKQKIKKKKKKT